MIAFYGDHVIKLDSGPRSEQAWLFWSQNCGQMENPSHGYFCEIPTHLLFIFVIHTRQQVKHEMKSHKTRTGYRKSNSTWSTMEQIAAR